MTTTFCVVGKELSVHPVPVPTGPVDDRRVKHMVLDDQPFCGVDILQWGISFQCQFQVPFLRGIEPVYTPNNRF